MVFVKMLEMVVWLSCAGNVRYGSESVLHIQMLVIQDVYYIQPTIPLEYQNAYFVLDILDNYGYKFIF